MTRTFWIVGLGLALFVNGGLTVGIILYLILHRHLGLFGFFNLLSFAAITWAVYSYLVVQIRQNRAQLP